MDDSQIKTIHYFITRPLMYINDLDKETVIAFVHGLEIGSNKTLNLSDKLSNLVEQKYRIKNRALGWPYQVQKYAEKRDLEWFTGFKELVDELLVSSQGK
ncbi:MAG: hypothetical protein ACFB15_10430 [Cyclobacteriaceae bacterium]